MAKFASQYTKWAMSLSFILCCSSLSAQDNGRSIQNFAEVQNSLKNNSADYSRLTSLINDEYESVYILDESEKVYGKSPVTIYTNLANISKLGSTKFSTIGVELIRVEISTLSTNQTPLDMEVFKNYKKLKYLYFLLEDESQLSDLQRLIDFTEAEFLVFYQIVKRS